MYSPKTHKKNSEEYQVLELTTFILNETAKENNTSYRYSVKNIYFDYGLDWFWTTIVADSIEGGMSYQFLTPAEQEKIIEMNPFEEEYFDYVNKIYSKKNDVTDAKSYKEIMQKKLNEIEKLDISDSIITSDAIKELKKILDCTTKSNDELRNTRNCCVIINTFDKKRDKKYISATVAVLDKEMFERSMEV